MSLRIHLLVSDVNQGNEEFDCKKVGSGPFCVAPGMERFSLYLPRAI